MNFWIESLGNFYCWAKIMSLQYFKNLKALKILFYHKFLKHNHLDLSKIGKLTYWRSRHSRRNFSSQIYGNEYGIENYSTDHRSSFCSFLNSKRRNKDAQSLTLARTKNNLNNCKAEIKKRRKRNLGSMQSMLLNTRNKYSKESIPTSKQNIKIWNRK